MFTGIIKRGHLSGLGAVASSTCGGSCNLHIQGIVDIFIGINRESLGDCIGAAIGAF